VDAHRSFDIIIPLTFAFFVPSRLCVNSFGENALPFSLSRPKFDFF